MTLELDDIQSGAVFPRPSPSVGTYVLLRIDDRRAGREILRRLSPALAAATNPAHRGQGAWVSAALTFQGLKALGVPQESLDSFPTEFQEGMAARAAELGDVGESSPENWERAALAHLSEVHSGLSALSPDAPRPEAVLKRARDAYHELPGIEVIWREGGRTATSCPMSARRLASRMASAIRPSKARVFLAATPKRHPSRRANLCCATRMSWAASPTCRSQRCWARTGRTWCSACSTHGWRRSASTCMTKPPVRWRRNDWLPRSSGAGQAARHWRSLPDQDDPALVGRPGHLSARLPKTG